MERIIEDRKYLDLKECTMSRLRESELDELKNRLTAQNGQSIFGRGSSHYWTKAYQYSYDYAERRSEEWPSLPKLRAAVRNRVPIELPFVTEREEAMIKRLLLFGGVTPLFTEDELAAADSLVKRLWCSCVLRDNGQLFVRLADALIKPMLAAVADNSYHELRARMFAFSATLHSMVYLHGMLYAEPVIANLTERLVPDHDETHIRLLYRYLKAEFDYCLDSQGNLVLIHPGLIHPERMLASISNAKYQATDYTREMIIGGMSELLKEESAAEEILRSELGFALQPGYNPGTMVNDVKFLIKQGATHEQLSSLISEKLAVRMTPQIEAALKRAETDTVRWQSSVTRRLN